MITTIAGEDPSAGLVISTTSVGQSVGLLSLAGDALCLAVTALRLSDPKAQQSPGTMSNPSVVCLEEVAWHDHITDCWVVIYDRVYNITDFLLEHPGGEEILLEYAGRDATLAFRGIGHSRAMLRALDQYLVGVLPESERIFCGKDGKIKLMKLATVY